MASVLYRLGRFCFRHRRPVLLVWVLLLVGVMVTAGRVGEDLQEDFELPGASSQQALDRMEELFPGSSGTSAHIVLRAPAGESITRPVYATAIRSALSRVATVPGVSGTSDPIEGKVLSPDRRTALATVQFAVDVEELAPGTIDAVDRGFETARSAGLQVVVGGAAAVQKSGQGSAEIIGLGVAAGVLLITFASFLAAGLPLLTALLGVGLSLAGIDVLSTVVSINSTAPSLALMLGLAVGIDYALFILSRHRSQLAQGIDPPESAALAIGTAGCAVFFAGTTVVIALLGLGVIGVQVLTLIGACAAAAVALAVAVALTLLPALFGLAGKRLTPRRRRSEAGASGPNVCGQHASGPERSGDGQESTGQSGSSQVGSGVRNAVGTGPRVLTGSERWVRLVTRKPLLTVGVVLAALGTVAVPAADLSLSLSDRGDLPANTGPRIAYDLITREFGPGANGPLMVFVDTAGTRDAKTAVRQIAQDLRDVPGVVRVTTKVVSPERKAAVLQVIPSSGPQDAATRDLVNRIRDEAPGIRGSTGAAIAVTGITAVGIDIADTLTGALLPYALVVVGLSLILLFVVFRSVLVPVTAALGFLLSVAAALGSSVAVFTWGWGSDLLSVERTGPVACFMPIVLLSVLFGLAMDYEVFLVSAMREKYVHGGRAREAVHEGAGAVGRVVVAAGLIMIGVFAGFALTGATMIKQIAFALAVGILVDAFVVRLTLVPALMALLGRMAWWLPTRVDRILPNVDLEGEGLPRPSSPCRRTRSAPAWSHSPGLSQAKTETIDKTLEHT